MKLCQKCNINKIKNNYQQCYECNNKEDSTSEPDTQYKKEVIPKTVRNCLWINFYGNQREGKCACCKRENITIGNFNCGHVIAERNGGTTTLDNMRPICTLCNTSMMTRNMDDFIKKFNLHHGV